MTINFVVTTDAMKSVATAAGISADGLDMPPCPLHAGDVMSFPDAPGLSWRIASRVLVARRAPAESEWLLLIEQTPDPIDEHEHRTG